MRSCREIEPQLSLLVDGLVAAEPEMEIRAHLRECAACRGLLADLERLRGTARSLGPITPPPHVWLEVAGQIHLDNPRTSGAAAISSRTSVRQWIGLAAALVLITGVLYIVRKAPTDAVPTGGGNVAATSSVETVTDELNLAAAHYEKAINELESMTKGGDASIDASVSTIVRNNLEAIDVAIADSRAALSSNPDSESARDSLFEALRRKISVLQATVALINEMRVGDQEGAAQAAEKLGKKS